VGRKVVIQTLESKPGEAIIRQAKEGGFDLIILPLPDEIDRTRMLALPDWIQYVLQNAPSRVLLVVNRCCRRIWRSEVICPLAA